MPKLVVSIDGVIVKEVQLTKDRSTIGRRPYNDVVIDNLAVSGEHAIVQITPSEVFLEDLGSTNGTYVNGKAIKRHTLAHDDDIEIGKYKVKYLVNAAESVPATLSSIAGAGSSVPIGLEVNHTEPAQMGQARGPRIRVVSGSAAGREVELTKVVTTVGKPGLSVASITRKSHGFDLAQVEGEVVPQVNGVSVDNGPITLKNRDQIELGGIRLEFIDR